MLIKGKIKMNKKILYLFVVTFVFSSFSCLTDKGLEPAPPLESSPQILIYLESSGDLINSPSFPNFISADSLNSILADVVILDLRSEAEFKTARIDGSINIAMKDLLNYIKTNVSPTKTFVLVDESSHKSVYASTLLRFAGIENVMVLKWGLASWNNTIKSWQNVLHLNLHQWFDGKVNSKAEFTPLPKIEESSASTDKLIEERVQKLLAENFESLLIARDTLNAKKFDNYLVCYGTQSFYRETQSYPGHFKNSVLYQPNSDFKSNTNLQTVASDKTVSMYDFDGTGSAVITAFFKMLGYNINFVKYGAHELIFEHLRGDKFSNSVVRNYPVVSGEPL